ncbi:hypothetical protein P9112_000789 [Eukaryota sp. TZLM1-RC]
MSNILVREALKLQIALSGQLTCLTDFLNSFDETIDAKKLHFDHQFDVSPALFDRLRDSVNTEVAAFATSLAKL